VTIIPRNRSAVIQNQHFSKKIRIQSAKFGKGQYFQKRGAVRPMSGIKRPATGGESLKSGKSEFIRFGIGSKH